MATKTTTRRTKVTPAPVAEVEPVAEAEIKEAAPLSKLPDLVDQIVSATGQKRNVVKPILEAFLAGLADRIAKGEDLALPPLGKLRVVKQKDEGGPITLKLKPQNPDSKSSKKVKEALADDED